MSHYMIIFYSLLLTAVDVQAQCDRPFVGENRVLADDVDQQSFPDGSTLKFKCSTGYVTLSGSKSITCTGTQWSDLELQCKKKSCGHPGEISNGKYQIPPKSGILFGATITATCNDGFQLVGYAKRNCLAKGWDGRAPVCEVVKCQPPPSIKGGRFEPIEDFYDYNDVVTYYCDNGVDHFGPSVLTCSNDGTFQPAPPRCTAVYCDRPEIPNAFRIEGKSPPYKYGNYVRYKCEEGYKMEGSDVLVCEENGWDHSLPQCTVITCLKPPTITNGVFNPIKESYIVEEKVTYHCVDGFKLHGSSTISCTDNGQFETFLSECRPSICDPPLILNSDIDGSAPYTYNSLIKIKCHKGYKLEGSESLTCGNDGWIPALPRCIPLICDAPSITDAYIVKGKAASYTYAMSIQVKCYNGYTMTGSDTLTCDENGWNPPPPKCDIITCLKPPTITNGVFNPIKESYIFEEKVTYDCVDGFKLHGSPTISCTDDGQFETFLSECRPSICDPPFILNSDIDGSAPYTYNSLIKIKCHKGYKLEGSESLTCGNDGWIPALPRCIPLICDAPSITDAYIVKGKAASYTYAMSIQVKCYKGYTMTGSDTLTCDENGWNPPPPKCDIVTCVPPPEINKGQFTPVKSVYEYGQSVTYSCEKEKFTVQGAATISCTEYGTFQHPPHCKEVVTCAPPSKINKGQFTPVKSVYEYGQTVTYSCEEEKFRIEGAATISCTKDGTFQHPPQCKEEVSDPWIRILVIVVCILILILLGFGGYYYYQKKVESEKSKHRSKPENCSLVNVSSRHHSKEETCPSLSNSI